MRCAVVACLATTPSTLPAILRHVRDERQEVRCAALDKVRAEIGVKQLTISQRAWLLEQGLGDRDATVRERAVDMLTAWLAQCEYRMFEVRGGAGRGGEAVGLCCSPPAPAC